MRRALLEFVLRGVLIIIVVGGLAYLAAGRSAPARPRRGAPVRLVDTFMPGAKRVARPHDLPADAALLDELAPLLRRIHRAKAPLPLMERIFAQDDRYLAGLIALLLSDEEGVARSAGETLKALCERRGILGERGGSPVELDGFGDPEVRAGLYETFAAWYLRNRAAIDRWGAARFRRVVRLNPF
jgi:hypothetical protein